MCFGSLQTLSPMCLPCARVHHVTTMSPPCVCSVSAVVRHVPALCQRRSTMCPLKPWPCLCPLLACCGAGLWQSSKILSHIAQPTAFILHARWSVSLAFILAPQIQPLQAHPMLEKLFGAYAGKIVFFQELMAPLC